MDEDEFFQRQDSRTRRPQRMSVIPDASSPRVSELPGDAQLLGPGHFSFRDTTVERCFYIGIDFGTTHSGVCWAWSGDPENIKLVKNWPSNVARGQENAKAPTRLQYHRPNHFSWGYETTSSESVEWFKLLLLEQDDIPFDLRDSEFLKTAREKLNAIPKTPEDAVADYLRKLWEHAISSIKRDRGQRAVDGLPFKVVITTPAVWPPYAQKRMRDAAQKAGILKDRACGATTLDLVQEPEAAALATLREFQSRDRSSVRNDIMVNDIYIVCDCGGGTVDVITYQVSSISPLEFGEYIGGDGKLCGAIFVDEEFERLVKQRLGTKWSRITAENKKRIIENDWEYGIKRLFTKRNKDARWSVQLPIEAVTNHFGIRLGLNDRRNRDVPITDGRIQFAWGHVNGVFQKSINGIRGLINNQIKKVKQKEGKDPKAIILVGGFGACNFLYETLVSENQVRNIEILQPGGDEGPWSAICRGAVIRASERPSSFRQTITSRVSRYHYGIWKITRFDPKRHEEQDKFWCDVERIYKADNQMDWYLAKSSDISSQRPVRFRYYQHLPRPQPQLSIEIFYSETESAPLRKSENVRHLCTLSTNLNLDFNSLQRYVSQNGRSYYELRYEIEMVVLSTSGSLEFSVIANDVRQGKKDIKVVLS